MGKIHPDKKYYVPVMGGERQLYLVGTKKQEAINNATKSEGKDWMILLSQGWTIEEFWGSEYE